MSLSFSLIHSIVHRVIKQAKSKATIAQSPALIETYSRLLVYMEIESLGIKGFISMYSNRKQWVNVTKELMTML